MPAKLWRTEWDSNLRFQNIEKCWVRYLVISAINHAVNHLLRWYGKCARINQVRSSKALIFNGLASWVLDSLPLRQIKKAPTRGFFIWLRAAGTSRPLRFDQRRPGGAARRGMAGSPLGETGTIPPWKSVARAIVGPVSW